MNSPPSTSSALPVVKLEAFEARCRTDCAIRHTGATPAGPTDVQGAARLPGQFPARLSGAGLVARWRPTILRVSRT